MISPRAIPIQEAARYVGCRSVDQFRREVRAGTWPRPIAPNSRPQRWSVPQLDAALQGDQGNDDYWDDWLDRKVGLK